MNTTRIVIIVGILFCIALSSCNSSVQQNNPGDTKPKSVSPLSTARPTTAPIQPNEASVKPKSIATPPPARPTTPPIQPGEEVSTKPKCMFPPLVEIPIPTITSTP